MAAIGRNVVLLCHKYHHLAIFIVVCWLKFTPPNSSVFQVYIRNDSEKQRQHSLTATTSGSCVFKTWHRIRVEISHHWTSFNEACFHNPKGIRLVPANHTVYPNRVREANNNGSVIQQVNFWRKIPNIHYMAGVENWSEHEVQKQTPTPARYYNVVTQPSVNHFISSFHMVHKHIKCPQIVLAPSIIRKHWMWSKLLTTILHINDRSAT